MNHPSHYLYLALEQAIQRRGFCAPNPSVGAVIVKEGKILSTGRHWASGHPHAEVDALQKIGKQAEGATLYVTLEPCCHYGKTPPCTDLIIKSGIKKVYFSMQDPNFQIAGKGKATLESAGISCKFFPLSEISDFYRSYHHWCQTKTPWVTAKIAISQDGKIAAEKGQPIQITGKECHEFTHIFRKKSDAILTTINTIINDNPKMNARINNEIIAKPIYVLDSQLRFPLQSNVVETAKNITIFYHDSVDKNKIKTLEKQNIRCIAINKLNEHLNLNEVLNIIGEDGVHDLWVEAGGRCFQSLFQANLINRALIYISPKILGQKAMPAFQESFNIMDTNAKIDWKNLGDDLCCELLF